MKSTNASPVTVLRRSPRSRSAPAQPVRVALVSMPYASITRPSIQLGLLSAIARRHGHCPTAMHLNMDFASSLTAVVGPQAAEFYERIAEQRFSPGDWFFAEAAFGDAAPNPELLIEALLENGAPERSEMTEADYVTYLHRIRDEVVPAYLDAVTSASDWSAFQVVGFTSTFHQNVSSFALARRLRSEHPDLVLLFGGANFDGDMGPAWLRSVPEIDYVISGEADESFPAFLDAIGEGRDPTGQAGVVGRRAGEVVSTPPLPFERLDENPSPDYRDYFDRVEGIAELDRRQLLIPYESARGCWWGQRRHCTFCGLNGQTMKFRSKSPQRVLDELTELALAYRTLRFAAVDNIIDTDYYDSLLPGLADAGRPFSIFYETKADLSRAHLELFARAGIDSIQPGIESLSSRMLGLMRKGTRAAWNVNVLRWSTYYGIHVSWNMLWGFPDERPEDTEQQVDAVGLLTHLQPPNGCGRLWMERFSPLFTDAQRVSASMRPHMSYGYSHPDHIELDDAAYFFDYEFDGSLPDEHYVPLSTALSDWKLAAASPDAPSLLVDDLDDRLAIHDRRQPSAPRTFVLTGLAMQLHRACMDTALTPEQLVDRTGAQLADVEGGLEDLVNNRLVYVDRRLHLALALPTAPAPVRGRVLETPPYWRTPVSEGKQVAFR